METKRYNEKRMGSEGCLLNPSFFCLQLLILWGRLYDLKAMQPCLREAYHWVWALRIYVAPFPGYSVNFLGTVDEPSSIAV